MKNEVVTIVKDTRSEPSELGTAQVHKISEETISSAFIADAGSLLPDGERGSIILWNSQWQQAVEKFGYVVPTKENAQIILENCKQGREKEDLHILDFGAGNGALSKMLMEATEQGLDPESTLYSKAIDCQPAKEQWVLVEQGDRTDLREYLEAFPSATVILSWPSNGRNKPLEEQFTEDMSATVLQTFLEHGQPGQRLIYIGEDEFVPDRFEKAEGSNDPKLWPGLTASPAFWSILRDTQTEGLIAVSDVVELSAHYSPIDGQRPYADNIRVIDLIANRSNE